MKNFTPNPLKLDKLNFNRILLANNILKIKTYFEIASLHWFKMYKKVKIGIGKVVELAHVRYQLDLEIVGNRPMKLVRTIVRKGKII